MTREEIIGYIVECTGGDPVVSTTEKENREFFEIRKVRGNNHECDFLVVGLRGRVSLIAFGIGVLKPDRMS